VVLSLSSLSSLCNCIVSYYLVVCLDCVVFIVNNLFLYFGLLLLTFSC
jgi:hypothetical protein